MARIRILCLFLILTPFFTFGEGVKELMPDSTVSAAHLYFTRGYITGNYPDFGLMNCPANYRLYIHVKNPGESIFFGLKPNYAYSTFNLRKPNGTIALSGSIPGSAGQTGYIRYYRQAIAGPFPAAGGYIPLQYQVTSIADTGNYYFEISNLGMYDVQDISIWDFQVVSGLHTPALPSDTINGRVWSQSWQFNAELSNYWVFNGRLFVLSDDGIVTKLKFSNARIGVATIFCNPTGCNNTGNPLSDRQSVPTNTYSFFPAIAQYKVFLNNPDPTVYPSGVFGAITGTPALIPDTAYPLCSGEKQVVVKVNKPGTVEIDLTFPYGAPATNIALVAQVITGTNYISWNGNDGTGNPVPDGTLIILKVIYMNGLTNLPIWDQEQNPDGYQITLVRPYSLSYQAPLLFWDDSNISGYNCPNTSNLAGCLPYPAGCHTWSGYDCHEKMINTWWYGNMDSATVVSYFTGLPSGAVGHDSTRCGPGSVILHATVPPTETVDWYDAITGGIPLLTGDTTYVTPLITMNTTYYAEARNDSSGCTSIIRTPVYAIVKPVPVPNLVGPQHVCEASLRNRYNTDPLKTDYIWMVSPGGSILGGSGTDQIFVSWNAPGIGQVSVNYSDTNGCRGSRPTSLYVLVEGIPDTAGPVNGPVEICAGTNGVNYFVSPITGANTYTWTVPSGVIIDAGAGTDAIIVNFPPEAESGYFKVYASDSCGNGIPSPPYLVTVYQPPVAFAGPDDSICQGNPFQVTLATVSDHASLLWTTNGQGYLSSDTTIFPVYHPSTAETGPVVLTLFAYERGPCGNDTSRMTIWIKSSPIVSAGPDASVCEGHSYMVSGAFAVNYQSLVWISSGSGHFSDPQALNPVYFPGPDDLISGFVYLTLQATPGYPCLQGSDSMKLILHEAPQVSAGPGFISCGNIPVLIAGASAANYDSLQWNHNGQGTLTGSMTLTPTYFPGSGETGNILLTLVAYGREACFDSVVQSQTGILIYPAVTANAGPDKVIPLGKQDTLSGSANGGSGFLTYNWEPASLLHDHTILQPVLVSLETDTNFILFVQDTVSGCIAADTVRIRIEKQTSNESECIKVYNVITPNGDGLNDTWIIDCIENYPDNKVRIFNIWGDLVRYYEHYDNVTQVWDGTNPDDKPVPDGTYYYVISIKNLNSISGWVLVRSGWKR